MFPDYGRLLFRTPNHPKHEFLVRTCHSRFWQNLIYPGPQPVLSVKTEIHVKVTAFNSQVQVGILVF